MYIERHSVTITTNADGDGTGYSPVVTGLVSAIHYVKAGSDAFDDGVDFVVTAEATGEIIWDEDNVNASKSVYPVRAASLTTGAASTSSEVPFLVAQDRVKIVVASGGNAQGGTFIIVMA